MPKKPDERITQAKQMYLDGSKLIDIAKQLDLPEGTVRRWKSTHKWDGERSDKKNASVRKKGGQPGNKNAGQQWGNQHKRTHGLFAKYLPPGLNKIIEEMPEDPLEMLWDQINIQYANIIHAQPILYVNDREDLSNEVSMQGEDMTAYAIQYAWDKQASNMSALSRSMKTLQSMIKDYEELLSKRSGVLSEEQQARINQMRAQTKKLEQDDNVTDDGAQDSMDAVSGIIEQMMPIGDDEV